MQTVAAFDFDGTLTTADSCRAFVRTAVGRWRYYRAALVVLPWLIGMVLRIVDRGDAKARFLRAAFSGLSGAAIDAAAIRFVHDSLPSLVRADMIERVREHHLRGHRIVLVSASPALYLKRWAAAYPFDAVLATDLQIDADGFHGHFERPNCWGPQKVVRLDNWWRDARPENLYVYGDSRGDREMAALATVAWIRGAGPLPTLPPLPTP